MIDCDPPGWLAILCDGDRHAEDTYWSHMVRELPARATVVLRRLP